MARRCRGRSTCSAATHTGEGATYQSTWLNITARPEKQRSRTYFASPHKAKTKERRTEKEQTGRLRYSGKQLAPDFAPGIVHGVDVEIGLSVFDSIDQCHLGLWEPALHGDEGWVVDQRQSEIEDRRGEGPGGHSQREPRKRRNRSSDPGIGAERCAAMDVCSRVVRRQPAERRVDLYRLGSRIQDYRREPCPRRHD